MLRALGLDPTSPELSSTPRRMADTWKELLAGTVEDPAEPLRRGEPTPVGTQTIALRNLEFRSLCAHHFLPFSGEATVVYEPGDRIVGIGSIVKALDILATRPQLQESLGQQFADCLTSSAHARGALVILDARHSCISDRGPREAAATLRTIATSGTLREASRRRDALLSCRGAL